VDTFDEMTTRTSERVQNTAQLVEVTKYLNVCMSETFFKLKTSIHEALNRMLFLLDYHKYQGEINS